MNALIMVSISCLIFYGAYFLACKLLKVDWDMPEGEEYHRRGHIPPRNTL